MYQVVLFVHVISDITLFIGIGAQLLAHMMLRRAQSVEQVSAIIALIPITDRIGVVGALFTIISGLYMALTVWGLQTGWISTALGSIILIIGPLIGGVIEPRTRNLINLANEPTEESLSQSLKTRIHDPILATALQTNLAVVVGIVFLMTTKPTLAAAIMVMGTAVLLGAVSGILLWRTPRTSRSSSE